MTTATPPAVTPPGYSAPQGAAYLSRPVHGCTAHEGGHRYRWAGRAASQEDCDRPNVMQCVCGASYVARCGHSSRTRCSPCSKTYGHRVSHVASSGFSRPGDGYFLTLTAPGNRAHTYRGQRCPCTPEEGVELATWNGECATRWNHFITDVRRSIGPCEYFAAKEVQERGALHVHALLRFERPTMVRASKLRALAIRHGFGHVMDLQHQDPEQAERTARYLSKYVTKSSTERERAPFVHRLTGEVGPGRWRTWTGSRSWGLSMACVRAAQRAWILELLSTVGDRAAEPTGAGAEGALDPRTVSYAPSMVRPTSEVAPV